MWQIKPLSIKRIADSIYLFSNCSTRPVHDDIDAPLRPSSNLFIVLVVLNEEERLSLGCSEDEAAESLELRLFNDACDFVQVTLGGCGGYEVDTVALEVTRLFLEA